MEYYSSEGEAFEFCGSLLAEEQNFTNIYQEKLTIKQISKVALPLDKRNTNAAALLILLVNSQILEEQHKGMATVPKLALDVMSCEVVRLLQLTKSSVVPLSYCVPRRVRNE